MSIRRLAYLTLAFSMLATACGAKGDQVIASRGGADTTETASLVQIIGSVSGLLIGFDPTRRDAVMVGASAHEWDRVQFPSGLRAEWVHLGYIDSSNSALLGLTLCQTEEDDCGTGKPHLLRFNLVERTFDSIALPNLPRESEFHLSKFDGDGETQWVSFSTLDGLNTRILRFQLIGREWRMLPDPPPIRPSPDGVNSCGTGEALYLIERRSQLTRQPPPSSLDAGPSPSQLPPTTVRSQTLPELVPTTPDAVSSYRLIRWADGAWGEVVLPLHEARNLSLTCGGGLLALQDFPYGDEVWITTASDARWTKYSDLLGAPLGAPLVGPVPSRISGSRAAIAVTVSPSSSGPMLINREGDQIVARRVEDSSLTATMPDGSKAYMTNSVVSSFGIGSDSGVVFDNGVFAELLNYPTIATAPAD